MGHSMVQETQKNMVSLVKEIVCEYPPSAKSITERNGARIIRVWEAWASRCEKILPRLCCRRRFRRRKGERERGEGEERERGEGEERGRLRRSRQISTAQVVKFYSSSARLSLSLSPPSPFPFKFSCSRSSLSFFLFPRPPALPLPPRPFMSSCPSLPVRGHGVWSRGLCLPAHLLPALFRAALSRRNL